MSGPPTYLDVGEAEVHLDRKTNKWIWENENGDEYEWHGRVPPKEASSKKPERITQGGWMKVISDQDMAKQQEVYRVDGTPAAPVLLRQQGKKRKEESTDHVSMGAAPTKRVRPNTSVYVTGLPLDAGLHEIAEVFARYGVLLEDDDGRPRVKLYHDPATQAFKGEALVVYFKPESVELAIQLLDDTYLRAAKGVSSGPRMKVERAEFHESPSKNDEEKRTLTETDKKNIRRRMHRMQNKLNDWDSGSDEDRASAGPSAQARTVILKRMFTLAELDEDPALLLDLKQDVREECETLGDVTHVVLWDKEPEGIMTVRFRDPAMARACERRMHGRYFAGRQIVAILVDGKPKFRRSARDDEEAQDRHDAFGAWLETA
ncbi:U2-type spliceosomal complex [Malassezia pachydermatis]